jgi:DNA-binding NarL/FixJ family response regulator
MAGTKKSDAADLAKRVDLIAATLLAISGLKKKEIAEVLDVSEKTVQRMFVGNLDKMRGIGDAKRK